jgi:hypothetical protein
LSMLKYKLKMFVSWLILGYLAIMAAGCGFNPLVIVAGEALTNKSSASVALPISDLPTDYDVLENVVKVGRSLGYRLVLKDEDSVGLHYQTFMLVEAATGLTRTADVKVSKGKNKIYIDVAVSGDFRTGGQAYADRVLGQFKGELQETFAKASSPQSPQRLVQY